jgi:hypothetical protein
MSLFTRRRTEQLVSLSHNVPREIRAEDIQDAVCCGVSQRWVAADCGLPHPPHPPPAIASNEKKLECLYGVACAFDMVGLNHLIHLLLERPAKFWHYFVVSARDPAVSFPNDNNLERCCGLPYPPSRPSIFASSWGRVATETIQKYWLYCMFGHDNLDV